MTIAVKAAYGESSQYKRWTYTRDKLSNIRLEVNEEAIVLTKQHIAQESDLGNPPKKEPEFPTIDEALLLVSYYAAKAFETGAAFNLPSHLKATAATYIKRFYLHHSPLQYHPKSIMITSLFLATKTCEHHVSLDTFVKKIPKLTKEDVIEHEFLISSTIKFDFLHWSAYRPLYGFVLDIEASLKPGAKELAKAHDAAKAVLNAAVWTDLAFLYSPSHIALAALHAVNERILQEYLEHKKLTDLSPTITEISEELKIFKDYRFDRKLVETIDKKVYYSSDPALRKDSALYKQAKESEEKEELNKRRRKEMMQNKKVEEFGQSLAT